MPNIYYPEQGTNQWVAGMIVVWSGAIANIPAGWVLCNGSSSTPDLRDKFVIGARSDDAGVAKTLVTGALTQSGGAATHTHDAHSAHEVTQPGAHSNHSITQPSAHSNHTVTQANAHSNHVITQPDGHTNHSVTQPADHTGYTSGADAATAQPIGALGATGSEFGHTHTVPDLNHSSGAVNAHSAHAGANVNAHSAHAGAAVDAHSAHAGADVSAHSAHSGATVNAHSAHSTATSLGPYYALAYMMKT